MAGYDSVLITNVTYLFFTNQKTMIGHKFASNVVSPGYIFVSKLRDLGSAEFLECGMDGFTPPSIRHAVRMREEFGQFHRPSHSSVKISD